MSKKIKQSFKPVDKQGFHKDQMLKQSFNGGWVLPMPNATKEDMKKDTVKTILQAGEMIIPLSQIKIVTNFLRSKKISFGNFK